MGRTIFAISGALTVFALAAPSPAFAQAPPSATQRTQQAMMNRAKVRSAQSPYEVLLLNDRWLPVERRG